MKRDLRLTGSVDDIMRELYGSELNSSKQNDKTNLRYEIEEKVHCLFEFLGA